MAESLESRANRHARPRIGVDQIARPDATSLPRGADAPLGTCPRLGAPAPRRPSTPGARWRVVLQSGKTPRPLCAASPKSPGSGHCPTLSRRARPRTGLFCSSPLDAARSAVAAWSRRNGLGLLAAVQDPAERWAFRRKAGLNARPSERRRSSRPPSSLPLSAFCRSSLPPRFGAASARARLRRFNLSGL